MVKLFDVSKKSLELSPDIAGSSPVYVYLSEDKSICLYSRSIIELLNDHRVVKPLSISSEGVSFLIQCGAIPSPKTIYRDVFVLSIGDKLSLYSEDGKILTVFSKEFPFYRDDNSGSSHFCEKYLLELLAGSTTKNMIHGLDSFLFHSAGKDSNMIALAIAEAGLQNKVTLVTHKSKDGSDESEISRSIAAKLGFRHKILYEVDCLTKNIIEEIESFFRKSALPSMDNVTLAYPMYGIQFPSLKNANIIDGMGNDVYIGHVPGRFEYLFQRLSPFLCNLRVMSQYFSSTNLLHPLSKTRAEWCGLSGINYTESRKIYYESINAVEIFCRPISIQKYRLNYFDFRAEIRGGVIDTQVFIQKVRNAADLWNSHLILPWADREVSEYLMKVSNDLLYDKRSLRNKICLRDTLKRKVSLDCDSLGKLRFTYDSKSLVRKNWEYVSSEIRQCDLWRHENLSELLNRWYKLAEGTSWASNAAHKYIYRVFLISMWKNYNNWT